MKWAAICALQASTHLSGLTRSVELAAIGRRVCESEWDLFVLLGVAPPAARPEPAAAVGPAAALRPAHARPSSSRRSASTSTGVTDARRGRGRLRGPGRAQRAGRGRARAHARPRHRRGPRGARWPSSASTTTPPWPPPSVPATLDDDWDRVAPRLAASARDQLLVANPSYLPPETRVGHGRRASARALTRRRRPPRCARAPMPWRTAPASRLHGHHEEPGVVEGGARPPPRWPCRGWRRGRPRRGRPRSGGSWRRGRSRWRSAAGGSGAVAAPPSEGSISPTPKPLSRLPGR